MLASNEVQERSHALTQPLSLRASLRSGGWRLPRSRCPRKCDHRPVPLNHVAVTVSDRERSAAFYGQHFDLTDRVQDDEHRLILGSQDGSLLALSEGTVPRGLPHTNHFGFQLLGPDDVRAARERLRKADVPEAEWQDDDAFVRVQVVDPDGYRVELFAYS
jgi:catechol 2,3-dioxygenase-like lactoylglutathione lyase family enzyme